MNKFMALVMATLIYDQTNLVQFEERVKSYYIDSHIDKKNWSISSQFAWL